MWTDAGSRTERGGQYENNKNRINIQEIAQARIFWSRNFIMTCGIHRKAGSILHEITFLKVGLSFGNWAEVRNRLFIFPCPI